MAKDNPDIQTPPINEVVFGIRFDDVVEELAPTHFGLFWGEIREEFGTTVEAPPLQSQQGMRFGKFGLPLPRFWLTHNNSHYLLQLQQDLFLFNWRQLNQVGAYPGYEHLKSLFFKYWDRYHDFLVTEHFKPPQVLKCELTYINLVEQRYLSNFGDGYSGLFKDVSRDNSHKRRLPLPDSLTWQVTYAEVEPDIQITAKVNTAQRVVDNSFAFRFEITAHDSSTNRSPDNMETWFDAAHDSISVAFRELTTAKARKEVWGLNDGEH